MTVMHLTCFFGAVLWNVNDTGSRHLAVARFVSVVNEFEEGRIQTNWDWTQACLLKLCDVNAATAFNQPPCLIYTSNVGWSRSYFSHMTTWNLVNHSQRPQPLTVKHLLSVPSIKTKLMLLLRPVCLHCIYIAVCYILNIEIDLFSYMVYIRCYETYLIVLLTLMVLEQFWYGYTQKPRNLLLSHVPVPWIS